MSNYEHETPAGAKVPVSKKNVNLTIDGIPVTIPEGTRILEAARKAGIHIPTLCDHPDLCRRSVCRICVVECDGKGKLMAACANDVWEGVNIVTNNFRILNIRKTILELILANHPQECLTCVKNQKCELQNLAATFGIRQWPFRHDAANSSLPKHENETLVRNMSKCIKCGRCVEVCQEVQTVRAINSSHRGIEYEICTPYGQALGDGPCIFCGQCAAVCPVGAIYEHDATREVWAALDSGEQHVVAEIAPSVAADLDSEFGFPAGFITSGKIVTALKRMGFARVVDAGISANETVREELQELLDRIKNRGKLPLITSCSPAWYNFTRNFYPDLADHLPAAKNQTRNFGTLAKTWYAKEAGIDKTKIISVSILSCIAKKYEARRSDMQTNGTRDVDVALTAQEIARMIKMAGVDFDDLPESPFDSIKFEGPGNSPNGTMETVVRKVYKAYTGESPTVPVYHEVQGSPGIKETELDVQGTKVKALVADGLANARIVMDSVRKGECDAVFVEVKGCLGECGSIPVNSTEKA